MKGLLTLFMVVLMISSRGEGQSRILVVMPFASPSHKNILVPLMTTLASRGHQLTFITGKPTEELRENPNITEIVVDLKVEFSVEKEDKDAVSFFQSVVDEPFWTKIKFMEHFSNIPESIIESTLGDPQVKRILTDGAAQFDLVLISMVTEYVGTPFAWHFKCPFIFFSPNVIFSDLPFVLGDWEHPEYVPFMVTSFTDNMNWLERTINTFLVHFTAQVQKNWFSPQIDEVVRRFLPGYPSMVDVERNVSLVFTNTHPSFSYPRALPPNVVEIGAIHCHPAKPLPKFLDEFIEGAGDSGFFVFSVGSIIQMNEMPPRILNIFKRAFSRIPQRVVWQWKNFTKDTEMPSNVLLSDWLPQQDILGHPRCKGFLTHGGLLSTQEAVYHGVPIIGLPFVSDQQHNVMKAVLDGYAIVLSWSDLDEHKLFSALVDIVQRPRYRSSAKRLQSLLRDQPQTPLDRAIYWTEYVTRHKGAPSLQLASRHLNRFQRSLLDVYFILAILWTTFVILAIVLFRCTCSRLSGSYCKELQGKPRNMIHS